MKKGDHVRMKFADNYGNNFYICSVYRNEDYPADALVTVSFLDASLTPRTTLVPMDSLELVYKKGTLEWQKLKNPPAGGV